MKRAYQNLVNALEELEEAEIQEEAARQAAQSTSGCGPTGRLVGQEAIEAQHLAERKAYRAHQRACAETKQALVCVLEVIRATFPGQFKASPGV